jgi:hypothetical protein
LFAQPQKWFGSSSQSVAVAVAVVLFALDGRDDVGILAEIGSQQLTWKKWCLHQKNFILILKFDVHQTILGYYETFPNTW